MDWYKHHRCVVAFIILILLSTISANRRRRPQLLPRTSQNVNLQDTLTGPQTQDGYITKNNTQTTTHIETSGNVTVTRINVTFEAETGKKASNQISNKPKAVNGSSINVTVKVNGKPESTTDLSTPGKIDITTSTSSALSSKGKKDENISSTQLTSTDKKIPMTSPPDMSSTGKSDAKMSSSNSSTMGKKDVTISSADLSSTSTARTDVTMSSPSDLPSSGKNRNDIFSSSDSSSTEDKEIQTSSADDQSEVAPSNIKAPTPPIQEEKILFLSNLPLREARERSQVFLPELELTSYAGFITVDRQVGNHLFFWLLEAQQSPKEAPMILWLGDGLGLSSMTGLLWNHGPFGVQYADVSGQRVRVFQREAFWAKHFSILYLDSPVGTGYSFSEQGKSGFRSSTTDVAEDLFGFLLEIAWIFPEFHERDLYIGGQSYAAKSAITLAQLIHTQFRGPSSIPFKGLILSAPLLDPATQMIARLNAKYNLGALSFTERNMYINIVLGAQERFEAGRQDEGLKLSSLIDSFLPLKLNDINFDNYVTGVREDNILIREYMTLWRVRSALHVGKDTQFFNFNINVYDKFGGDYFRNFREELANLMDTYKVLIYSGDYDISIHNSGLEVAILNLPWSHKRSYINATRHVLVGEDNTLHGFYTQVDKFCRFVVHGAGHQASHDRPWVLERLVTDFVEEGCISDNV